MIADRWTDGGPETMDLDRLLKEKKNLESEIRGLTRPLRIDERDEINEQQIIPGDDVLLELSRGWLDDVRAELSVRGELRLSEGEERELRIRGLLEDIRWMEFGDGPCHSAVSDMNPVRIDLERSEVTVRGRAFPVDPAALRDLMEWFPYIADWEPEYDEPRILDGGCWELKIGVGGSDEVLRWSGINMYPHNFDDVADLFTRAGMLASGHNPDA